MSEKLLDLICLLKKSFTVFSLYNVILFYCPRGTRKYLHGGYFVVKYYLRFHVYLFICSVFVRHKNFFSLKSPWNHNLTPVSKISLILSKKFRTGETGLFKMSHLETPSFQTAVKVIVASGLRFLNWVVNFLDQVYHVW